MKYKITIYFIILFLTSCTLMERTGIEKRRYRSGYYISHAVSQRNIHTQHPADIAAVETVQENNTVLAVDGSAPDTEPGMRSSEQKQAPLTAVKVKKGKADKTKEVIEKIRYVRPMHDFFRGRSAACAVQAKAEKKDCGDGCFNLLMEIAVVLLAIIILLMFPGIDPELAQLLAIGVLIVAAIVVLIVMNTH